MDELEQQVSRSGVRYGAGAMPPPRRVAAKRDPGLDDVAWPELVARELRTPDLVPRPVMLVRLIEREVLPRLALIPEPPARAEPSEEETVALLALVTGDDEEAPEAHMAGLLESGRRAEDLCLGLLTATARTLGEMWEDDRTDFVTVTIGLGRLQRLLRHLIQSFEAPARMDQRRVLLATVPGEQHTMGLSMVAAFFERAGWDVHVANAGTVASLARAASGSLYDVLGLSAGTHVRAEMLTQSISAVRAASMNQRIKVLVGGPLIINAPELIAQVGADATAADGPSAVAAADRLTQAPAVADHVRVGARG